MWEAEMLTLVDLTVEAFTAWARTEFNPYKVTRARVMLKRKKEEAEEERRIHEQEQSNSFDVMMKSSAEQWRKANRKKNKRSAHPGSNTATTDGGGNRSEPLGATVYEEVEGADTTGTGTLGNWSKHTVQFIQCIVEHVKSEIHFEERGTHCLKGKWPRLAYPPVIEPSDDPQSWLNMFKDIDDRSIAELGQHDFAYPGVMVWAPELRWPHLYPNNRPRCCFHGTADCVAHIGWSHYPRCCYGTNGNIALIGRRYRCKLREAAGENPFTFYSYATAVLAAAPAYVQGYWRKHGFRITHRGAIAWEVVDRSRSLLANGAEASGMHSSLIERYKQNHACRRKMWRCHVNHVFATTGAPRTLYYDFDDDRAELRTPSLAYLLYVTMEEIESKMPYYNRKMQMVFGRKLSADHSHKVAKVVLVQGERGFDGIYTVMNEVGKVLAFWFVSGTTLAEVENSLRKIENRYTLHSQGGPFFFTTADRCCDERTFFAGDKNTEKKPIFPSLNKNNEQTDGDQLSEEATLPSAPQPGPMFVSIERIDLPTPPIIPSTLEIAEITVGEIIRRCHANMWNVIALDSEWAFGVDKMRRKANGGNVDGPDVTQIGLPDGSTYVFLNRQYGKFPNALRQLLDSIDIKKKVAHKISSDKAKHSEIGVQVNGAIELGTLARERGVVRVANCALSEIIAALFQCEIDKDPNIRLCDWGKDFLSDDEMNYAAIDAYAHMKAYLKIMAMPYVDPSNMPKSKASELLDSQVLLFTKNMNCVVASGTVVSREMDNTLFGQVESKTSIKVRVSRGDVRQIGAIVATSGMRSFQDLLDNEVNDNGFIIASWKVARMRRSPPPTDHQDEVTVVTKTVLVPVVPPVPMDDLDIDPDPSGVVENEDGDHKGVKQDIAHIFLRFSKVIKKSHGAFGSFMARLSDVIFVPYQADIAFIKEALRKSGVSEDEIKAKPWQYFKRRVRRTVPKPATLERDFKRVVNVFANVQDSKTGEPLFVKKVWALYRSTLRHIRKGCLSDIPGEVYYVQIGVDSMQIPIFKCLRGTSALEGFHQKIRQLVRGFNITPRYAIALLMEYICRWNHDIDVRILGLARKYANYYDGWEIEEEIDVTADWDDLFDVPHSGVRATKHFASTGEDFGLNKAVVDSKGYDEELEQEIALLIDAINDGSLEDEVDSDENVVFSKQELTGSAAWVASKMGRSRPWGKVRTVTEKQFFRDNYHHFQGSTSDEADNFGSIAYSRFSLFWNELVDDEERGRRPKSDMSLKTAFSLQAYWKELKKESNTIATLLPVYTENKAMRRELRGDKRVVDDDVAAFLSGQNVMRDEHMQTSRPGLDTQETKLPARVAPFVGPLVAGTVIVDKSVVLEGAKARRSGARCRNCGHEYAKGNLFSPAHTGMGMRGSALFKRPEEVCKVLEHERLAGFPLAEGQKMPRRSRAKS